MNSLLAKLLDGALYMAEKIANRKKAQKPGPDVKPIKPEDLKRHG